MTALILTSLASLFLLIALGHVLARTLLPQQEAWKGIERLAYYLLIPVLIMKTIIGANLREVPFLPIAAALLSTNLLMCLVLLIGQKPLETRFRISGPSFSSIFQGAMRWNAFIALAIANSLYGNAGTAMASVAMAVLIPVLNIESVLVLRRYGAGQGGSLLHGLATNPYLVGTVVGILVNISGLPLPDVITMTLDIIGRGALGIGILLVGAGLNLQDLRRPNAPLILGVTIRLIILPVIGAAFATLFGLSGPAFVVVVVCLGVPAASSAYVLARQMGGDAPLIAAILTAQTVMSAITLPLLLLIFNG